MKRIFLIIVFLLVSGLAALGQTNEVNQENAEIKILWKQKANYTDIARRKNVEGWVRLRITFLASGEIGEVVYVAESSKKKKLTKNGLVEAAIEAAKKIKFEPQIKEGKPVTVTKLVEYNFTTY